MPGPTVPGPSAGPTGSDRPPSGREPATPAVPGPTGSDRPPASPAGGTGEAGEAGSRHAELPTDAPRVGRLAPLPPPRLTGETTGLPSLRADGGLLHGCWVAAASITGTSHLLHGTTGQDVYRYAVAHDGSGLVLVVCDGLGSRPSTAQRGAALLAAALCEEAAHLTGARMALDPREALLGVLVAANDSVRRHRAAALRELTDSDLAATVALCWLPLPGPEPGQDPNGTCEPGAGRSPGHAGGHVVRVGDCHAFTLTDGVYANLFPVEEGPANLVSGQLPSADVLPLAEYAAFPTGGTATVILATDGLAGDLFDSPSVRDWLAERWAVPCGGARMLDSLRYRRAGSHDDRTALVAWPPRTDGTG
ncbi:protein phosphatase 2C domain-containing protein [Streptomyces sp. NPDC005805]|uniref:protein phosphatase 2C domain-containing protein n=1 Tax=Streptomyces sp. NPDC005805 TaxID=3157068 RepID=UPI0033DA468E